MSFVHVINRRRQAECFQGAQPANAENNLLPDARVVIATVELIGDGPVFRSRVLGNVGIEQNELHAAHVQKPDLDLHRTGGHVHRNANLLTCGVHGGQNGERVEIAGGNALLLPAIRVQELAEVAVLIKQAHAHQRHIEVARRLQMIA